MPSARSGYLDPQLIAQTLFTYPNKWKLDGENLAAGETIEEKEKIRQKRIRDESYKVQHTFQELSLECKTKVLYIFPTTSSKFHYVL